MTVLSLMQSDVMSWWDMSYDGGKQGFGWVLRMGFLLCWTKNDSLKKTKAALSQLHKISPCSRWTLFVSWFILPEFVRNLALLSSCHLVHPSEVFSITERSWEKNCWLLEGLTFKKKKKTVFWTDAFTTYFPVPENNSSPLQHREPQNPRSLI